MVIQLSEFNSRQDSERALTVSAKQDWIDF